MAAPNQWEFGTQQAAEDVRDAIALADGLPRKARQVGGGIHAPISDTPGGAGWSLYVHDVETRRTGGRWAISSDAHSNPHAGKVVRVRGGNVTIPQVAAAVARGSEWDPPSNL